MPASTSKLSRLHEMLAEMMIEELETYKAEGLPVPAADKAAIAKFLKDNNVTCDPINADDIDKLRKEFQSRLDGQRSRIQEQMSLAKDDLESLYGSH